MDQMFKTTMEFTKPENGRRITKLDYQNIFPPEILLYFFFRFDTHKTTDVEDSNKLDSFFLLTFTAFTHRRTTNARHKHILFI